MSHNNRFDTLRLFAAWLVLYFHCYPLSGIQGVDLVSRALRIDSAGGLGVGIFFALSGYLVSLSLLRSRSLLDFAWRRALRIYPALVLLILLSAFVLGPAVTTLAQGAYFTHPLTWQYLWTATGWDIHYVLPGVFEGLPLRAVNGSLWSLKYEILCYLVLAATALVPVSLRIKSVAFALLLGANLLTRPAGMTNPFELHAGLDFYMAKMGFIFALGAVMASWQDTWTRRTWNAIGAAGAVAFVGAIAVEFAAAPRQLVYCAGLGAFVTWLALFGTWLPRIPARMGDWSYGVYLYGFPVQQVLTALGVAQLGMGAYLAGSTALSCALAALSWHLVEKRFIRLKARRAATGAGAVATA